MHAYICLRGNLMFFLEHHAAFFNPGRPQRAIPWQGWPLARNGKQEDSGKSAGPSAKFKPLETGGK